MFSLILFISVVLFLLAVTLFDGFVDVCNSYKTEDVSLCEIQMWPENDSQFNLDVMKKIGNLAHVKDTSQYFNIDLMNEYKLTIVKTDLTCLPMLRGMNRSFSFAPMSFVLSNNKKQYVDPIIYGRNFDSQDVKKAVIDEGTCYVLGYNNPKEIIGETITLTLSDITISDIEIVGVCSYLYGNYYEDLSDTDSMTRTSYLESSLCHPVFFSDDIINEVINSNEVIDWSYENLVVYVDNTDNVKEVCEKAKELFGYSSSSMISSIEEKAENVKNICMVLYTIGVIILLVALISIANMLIIKIERQKKFSEMILKIGFKKNDIVLSYIFENLYITLKSGIIAICTTMLVSVGIDLFVSVGYREITSYDKSLFLLDLKTAAIFLALLMTIVALLSYVVSVLQVKKLGRKILKKK